MVQTNQASQIKCRNILYHTNVLSFMADKAQLNYKTTKLATDSRAHIFHPKELFTLD